MFSWISVGLIAILSFIIGRILARRFQLRRKMRFALCLSVITVIIYIFFSWLLSASTGEAKADTSEETAEKPEAIVEMPKPIIDMGLQPLSLTIATFKNQYNQVVSLRYPEMTKSIYIPDLPIEKGLINDVLRFRNHADVVLTISTQKSNQLIDEITLMTSDHPPQGIIGQTQAMTTAALYAIANNNFIIDHEISTLFIEATTAPDSLIERYIGDILVSAMLNSSGNMMIRLSKPVENHRLPSHLLFEEDY